MNHRYNNMRLRYLFLYFLAMSSIAPTLAQDVPGSSIVSRTFLSPDGTGKAVQRVYDNGLGDVVQEIQSYQGSALPNTVVSHEYDRYRRRTRDWLPVTTSDSTFVSGSTVSGMAQSQYSDTAPFSRTEYDGFLPAQSSAQYRAGAQWQGSGRKVSVTYSEYVGAGMFADPDTAGFMYTLSDVKYLRTQTVDEDGCPRSEYTDLYGRLVISETSQGRTYYIYNEKGDVTYVIPPILSAYILSHYGSDSGDIPATDGMMQKYAYIYRYDRQRHCIYRKLPGCEPVYCIYDRTGTCILTQDGNQRTRYEWTYTIPDRFGRPCISGVCSKMLSYTAEPLHSVCVYAEYDGTSVSTGGYAVHNLALGSQTLYSAAYYDDYSFIGHNGVPSSLVASSVSGFPVNTSLGRGLQTGIATAVLGSNDVTGYTYSAMYYDSRFNVAQVNSTNHLGGNDITCTTYSYTGKPLNVKTLHTKPGAGTLDVNCSYTYDGLDRLVQVTHSINGSTPVTLASYTYDAVGRVSSKTVGGLETTSYTYNVRSWPTKISGQRFTERLCYNAAVEGLAPGLAHQYRWNGTVAAYAWLSGSETLQRGYSLLYDGLDRLTTANYGEGPSLESYHTKYDEKAEYDCMGNPTWIYRRSPDVINDIRPSSPSDRLRLEYDGNHLVHVTDSVTSGHDYAGAFHFEDGADETVEYEYDGNGNMTKDLNRNITEIRYNSLNLDLPNLGCVSGIQTKTPCFACNSAQLALNLPSMIAFGDNTYIYYTYSATGEKLTTRYVVRFLPLLAPGGGDLSSTETESPGGMGDDISGSGTRVLPSVNPSGDMTKNYCGNVVYDSGERMLLTDEGYVTFAADGTPQYHYYLKNHLGNVRVVMGQAGAVEQVNHYYAFGSLMRESSNPGVQPYKITPTICRDSIAVRQTTCNRATYPFPWAYGPRAR